METTFDLKKEFQNLIEDAYRISRDAGFIIENALSVTKENPMTEPEAEKFFKKVSEKLKEGSSKRGDKETLNLLNQELEKIIHQAMKVRENVLSTNVASDEARQIVKLTSFFGKEPGPVHPRPTFHRREIPMNCGGVRTKDILLWEKNERLDIHIAQFRATNGKAPSSNELLDIMLSKMSLPGLSEKDQFKIEELALSIANNGVRKPPIIDTNGTLLDGNRRVAACYYILNSDDFLPDQKKRAENIFVWQLTEYATEDDKNAVVVSLNFEPDNKQDWSEYVKAKIIYEEWQAILERESRTPSAPRIALMKRDLALKFGFREKDVTKVNRYIRMMNWANDFEDYLVEVKQYDQYEVKHQASNYFQYFDELSKGTNPGGVAYTLNQDEAFKHLVFELLFQGKFVNWNLIRNLRYYNEEVVEEMIKARETSHVETAQDMIETKLNAAKANQKEARIGSPNQRIEVFTKWLEQVPISAFRDVITPSNLRRLQGALQLVERQISDLGMEEN